MKLKKRQYRELMSILKMQADVIEIYCLEHIVAKETVFIAKNIKSAILYLGSAHDQLAELMKEKEGKCDE